MIVLHWSEVAEVAEVAGHVGGLVDAGVLLFCRHHRRRRCRQLLPFCCEEMEM